MNGFTPVDAIFIAQIVLMFSNVTMFEKKGEAKSLQKLYFLGAIRQNSQKITEDKTKRPSGILGGAYRGCNNSLYLSIHNPQLYKYGFQ